MQYSGNDSVFSGTPSGLLSIGWACRLTVFWHIGLFSFALMLLLLCWPVSGLFLQADSGDVAWLPCPLGISFSTQLIHSVQLTPVEEEYFVHGKKIWSWQERVQSHGAGLPSTHPDKGRIFFEPPWMVIEGRRDGYDEIFYRVGTEKLGKNRLFWGNQAPILLYRRLPSARIRLSVSERYFLWGSYKKIE